MVFLGVFCLFVFFVLGFVFVKLFIGMGSQLTEKGKECYGFVFNWMTLQQDFIDCRESDFY